MPTFTVARNAKTSLYEVHLDGCFHLKSKHMQPMGYTVQAQTGQQVAIEGEDGNEGCLYALGPCAKAGAVDELGRRAKGLERLRRYFDEVVW